ncbi:family 43 glycosylhydrolase [Planctomyces sp. SH-PL62]|uniref:glycoside hydrolase family 43 protein n=1 Tax=Planctomyces sp. SH-PL62 TaxID=1636152 RepID=UPI00078B52D2|nr:glycoside hydrolase family 43 protein [Planctomyces sp. SH-PL62]AMV39981.1 Extracellular exo-alpha-(1->5)-L-arabinofuranosidase precursor [Planctomyces sp. SH-PL62]
MTPTPRRPLQATALVLTLALGGWLAAPDALAQDRGAAEPAGTFRNPLKLQGADPWLMFYDGWYHLATTTGRDVRLRRARRLGDLKTAPDQVVWKEDDASRNRDLWAPEFHRLESGAGPRWYLYFTAGDGREPSHRMYVAESSGDDPMGPYTFKAKLQTDPRDAHYAIDGTVLQKPDGSSYFIWCGRPSPTGQGLYISRMTNPWTLTGPRVYLDVDGLDCDVVREGPVALRRGDQGRIFLIYSTCPADTPDYKLGMVSMAPDADPMKSKSWEQTLRPVFQRDDAAGVYGPGHNSFFKSPDGLEDWIAYHAKSGTAVSYADRSTRAQKFTWNADGTPNFGKPLSTDLDVPAPSGEPASGDDAGLERPTQ